MSAPEARARATTYTVSCAPDDMHEMNASLFDIKVEHSGRDRWAVRWMGRCLDAYLEWHYEPIPSCREDDWLDAHRFDKATALELAKAASPHLVVNGRTVDQVAKVGQS